MTERIRVSGLAIVSTVVLFFVATGLFNANLMVFSTDDPAQMTVLNVFLFTVLASALAILLASVLDRFAWGRTAWTIVALVVLGASIISVFGLDLAAGDLIWQALLHAVFGLLIIVGFYVGWPERHDG